MHVHFNIKMQCFRKKYTRLQEKTQSEYTHGTAEVGGFGESMRGTSKKEWMSIIKFQDLAGREVEVYAVREKEN